TATKGPASGLKSRTPRWRQRGVFLSSPCNGEVDRRRSRRDGGAAWSRLGLLFRPAVQAPPSLRGPPPHFMGRKAALSSRRDVARIELVRPAAHQAGLEVHEDVDQLVYPHRRRLGVETEAPEADDVLHRAQLIPQPGEQG